MRALFAMSVRVLFWLASRRRGRPCRHGFLGGVPSVPCAGRWRAASLYALLTGFHAPTPPRVRFVAARLREARTARLVGRLWGLVYSGVSVGVFLVREVWCWDVSRGRVR